MIDADRTIRDRYTGTSTIRVPIEGDKPDAIAIMRATSALATPTLVPALVLIFEPRFLRKGTGRS